MTRIVGFYLLAGLFVAADFIAAWGAAAVIRKYAPVLASEAARLWAFLVGSAALLVAAIGRLGWSIQTIGGVTPPERLDQGIFLALSLTGTFLLVFEFALGRLK